MPKSQPLLHYLIYILFLAILIGCQANSSSKSSQEENLADLGHFLFFDTRLSYNQTKSCSSCHDPKFAFTDGYRRSITASGDIVTHNSPSLINIANHHFFDWANPYIHSILDQSERPLMNNAPIELGFKGHETEILLRFNSEADYKGRFSSAFNEPEPINLENIRKALAAYVNSIRSENAPYDLYNRGDSTAISSSAKKGMKLFYSQSLNCGQCHRGPDLTVATLINDPDSVYFNTGLYYTSQGGYPSTDRGIATITNLPQNDGKFKVPSLRNVQLTAPYTHDGTVNNLSEMIDIYARGGRLVATGPHAGDGSKHPLKSPLIRGFKISPAEKAALIDFLFTLTDSSILHNPLFQDPQSKSHK